MAWKRLQWAVLNTLARDNAGCSARRSVSGPEWQWLGRSSRRACSTDSRSQSDKPGGLSEEDYHVQQVLTPKYSFKGQQATFPCLLKSPPSGPEPEYDKIVSGYEVFRHERPFYCHYNNCVLPEISIAYETWGKLNEKKDNAVLIFSGLSASSHAKSHQKNASPGWWERFIGPGLAIDTDQHFVICANNLGGCYGSTGPSSVNPLTAPPAARYATTFPVLSVTDMVRAQFMLVDHLGIDTLHSAVGASLGGMCSLLAASLYRKRLGRIISISSCAQAYPGSIAMRYLQRRAIMSDPNWNNGHYYDGDYPRQGMKLAREIATISYRSGPEWDRRFGRSRVDDSGPSLCPTFNIETYLEYQGEQFCNKYDPNSLLYISKAMDLFDISEGYPSITSGLARIKCPVMIIGIQTDILFPIWQQRLLHQGLLDTGNEAVVYYELNSEFGHDTFLLDLSTVGAAVKGFLETHMKEFGNASKSTRGSSRSSERQERDTIRHLFDPVKR